MTTTGLMGWIDPKPFNIPNTGDMAGGAISFSAMLFSLGAATLCAVKLKGRKDGNSDNPTPFPA